MVVFRIISTIAIVLLVVHPLLLLLLLTCRLPRRPRPLWPLALPRLPVLCLEGFDEIAPLFLPAAWLTGYLIWLLWLLIHAIVSWGLKLGSSMNGSLGRLLVRDILHSVTVYCI